MHGEKLPIMYVINVKNVCAIYSVQIHKKNLNFVSYATKNFVWNALQKVILLNLNQLWWDAKLNISWNSYMKNLKNMRAMGMMNGSVAAMLAVSHNIILISFIISILVFSIASNVKKITATNAESKDTKQSA